MKNSSDEILANLANRYPSLIACQNSIRQAIEKMIVSFQTGGKLLICGNGGSAADSEHIVGELMKGFVMKRPLNDGLKSKLKKDFGEDGSRIADTCQMGLPAISLVAHTALTTAFSNDQSADLVFAQQVLGYGKKGDVLLGISTSGNSKNVVYAVEIAKELGMITVGLTGNKQSRLLRTADITIQAPEFETYKIQEMHLPIYHAICLVLENEFFDL